MPKLTGYNRVAVIEQSGRDYHFALYDDDIVVGDEVLLMYGSYYYQTGVIKEIITPEEASVRFKGYIIAEVLGKTNLDKYRARVASRKRVESIKKEMDKKIKELQARDKYEIYAEKNPEIAELLSEYKSLGGE